MPFVWAFASITSPMWSAMAAFASGFDPAVTFPVACTVLPSDMLPGATVTLFTTVVLAGGACAATVSTAVVTANRRKPQNRL